MRRFVRWPLYFTVMLLIFAAQTAVGQRVALWGFRPELTPFVVAAVAVLEGAAGGAWFGMAAGLVADAFYPVGVGYFPVLYFLLGAACGTLTELFFRKNAAVAMLLGGGGLILSNLGQYLFFYMVFSRAAPLDFLQITAGELAYSLVLAPLAWLPLARIHRALSAAEGASLSAPAGRITGPRIFYSRRVGHGRRVRLGRKR